MNKEKQRIKIAEACGWKNVRKMGDKPWSLMLGKSPMSVYSGDGFERVPDYMNDLNAMDQVKENVFRGSDAWITYIDFLCNITGAVNVSMLDALISTNRATATQQAEAFLKTLNLWEDENER